MNINFKKFHAKIRNIKDFAKYKGEKKVHVALLNLKRAPQTVIV